MKYIFLVIFFCATVLEAQIIKRPQLQNKNAIVYVSKEAPIALKTRVYLNNGKFPIVITDPDELNRIYSLTAA